jgi:hypothetical protein
MLQGLTPTLHHTSKPLSLLISAIPVRSVRRKLCLGFGIASKDSREAAKQGLHNLLDAPKEGTRHQKPIGDHRSAVLKRQTSDQRLHEFT